MEDDILAQIAGLSAGRAVPDSSAQEDHAQGGRGRTADEEVLQGSVREDRRHTEAARACGQAAKGIQEGRRCSGRAPALDDEVKRRFAEMAEASADLSDERFMFVSRKCRTIENYRCWLEEEFGGPLSIHALRRYAKTAGLKRHLEKPDFGQERTVRHAFVSVPVFGLVQMDGCTARYIRIRDSAGRWKKPVLIEIYDTRSRYMFSMDAFFGESSRSALRLFSNFLLSVEFPGGQSGSGRTGRAASETSKE